MTIDELKEFMQDENNKEAFTQLVKDAGFIEPDDIQGLKNKNSELLGKLKKAKDDYSEKLKILDNIDINAYNEYIDNKDKSSSSERELSKAMRELEDFKMKYNKVDSEFNNVLKLMKISEALDEAGIDKAHKKILTSAFISKAKVEIDDDTRQVTIDDDGLGLPPKEYFLKWIEQDGKHYLKQPDNKGGNSNSSGFNQSSQTISRAAFDKLPATEKMSLIEQGVNPID